MPSVAVADSKQDDADHGGEDEAGDREVCHGRLRELFVSFPLPSVRRVGSRGRRALVMV
jgi:hypothetical protein